MVPVAEITGDSLRAMRATSDWNLYGSRFIAEFLRQGSEFALFRNGTRVGTFVTQGASIPDSTVCPRLPRATGSLELSPGGERYSEFLALSKAQAPDVRRRIAAELEPTRSMQIVGPILAERLLRARGAQLPGNWQRAMAQLKPFPITGSADPGFTATFLVDDTLGIGLDNQGYSLFFVATPQGGVGYDTAFVMFNDYPRTGKQAPRVVDYLDWNRDDQVEMLLQVYGSTSSWFEAVGKTKTGWRRTFADHCEGARPSMPAPPAPGTLPSTARRDSARRASQPPTPRTTELLGPPARADTTQR
jgi:hypothetical protein